MRPIRTALPTLMLPLAVMACQQAAPTETGLDPVPARVGNATLGRADFAGHCAGCHASGDGVDLAFFSFPDSTIVRRAVAHVDTTTAIDIVAHVRTLATDAVPRGTRLFQPGGSELVGDVAFALALFGADAWPRDATTADIAAIEPRGVRIAVPLPRWSSEGNERDWMPDRPLPEPVLDAAGGIVRAALARYRAAPSEPALAAAVVALRGVTRRESEEEVCGGPVTGLEECFEIRRWISTLVAQHMIRTGDLEPIDPLLHATWWDVGNVARISVRDGERLADAEQNWAAWMQLSWMFDPAGHASVYLGNALLRLDLPRHATFTALRSQVARPPGSYPPYADARNAARFAPASWTYAATRFGFAHLLERLALGDRPPEARRADAHEDVNQAWTLAALKVGPIERAELATLRDAILDQL